MKCIAITAAAALIGAAALAFAGEPGECMRSMTEARARELGGAGARK